MNKQEKRIIKLNDTTILIELNMTTKDEGCTLIQIIAFCEKHKITYYAVDCSFFYSFYK